MLAGSQDISTPDFTAKFASLPGAAACAIMALSAPKYAQRHAPGFMARPLPSLTWVHIQICTTWIDW